MAKCSILSSPTLSSEMFRFFYFTFFLNVFQRTIFIPTTDNYVTNEKILNRYLQKTDFGIKNAETVTTMKNIILALSRSMAFNMRYLV